MFDLDHPVLVAHRGYALGQDFDRNSYQAFKYATEIGADALETDLRLTSDGEIVIHHNRFIRDGFALKFISNHSYEDLIAAKGSADAIPTLDQLLQLNDDKLPLFLQIKAAKDAPTILEYIKSTSYTNFIIMGYLTDILGAHTTILKDMNVITGKHYMLPMQRNIKYALSYPDCISTDIISPYFRFLTETHIEQVASYGFYNIPFTINRRSTMVKLGNHQYIDGFYTDYLEDAIDLFH